MQRDPRALLWDVRDSAQAVLDFTHHLDLDAYLARRLVRSAVEREFAIVGEALGRLARLAPELADRIPDWPR